MSVEQTTQLIQLILNSVLLTVACVLVLGRVGVRQTALEDRMKTATRQLASILDLVGSPDSGGKLPPHIRLGQAKKSLRQLQRHYQINHYSHLVAYYAFLLAILSTFTLALRTLLNADWLISIALGLFVISISGLALSIGLTLIDLHYSRISLWEEMEGMLELGKRSPGKSRSVPRSLPPRTQGKMLQQSSPHAKHPARARVG